MSERGSPSKSNNPRDGRAIQGKYGSHLRLPESTASFETNGSESKANDSLLINDESSISVDLMPSEDLSQGLMAHGDDDNILTIENEDLQDFKNLQSNVKNILELDTSEWLRRPIADHCSERSPNHSPTRNSGYRSRSRSRNRSPRRSMASSSHGIVFGQNIFERNDDSNRLNDEYELQDVFIGNDGSPAKSHASYNIDNRSTGTSGGLDDVQHGFHGDEGEEGDDYSEDNSSDASEYSKPVEEHLQLYGKSLGIISPFNSWRLKCAKLLLHKWYRPISMAVLLFYTIFLGHGVFHGAYGSSDLLFQSKYRTGVYITSIIFNWLFTFETIAKIVAFGFWNDEQLMRATGRKYDSLWELTGILKFYRYLETTYSSEFIHKIMPIRSLMEETPEQKKKAAMKSSVTVSDFRKVSDPVKLPRAYTRSSWGRLELLSTFSAWMALLLSINTYDDKHGARLFRPLMAFRILKLVDLDQGLVSILRTLKYGVSELLNVGFMLLYFWVIFGVLGIQTFKGSLKRQCVWSNPNDPSDTYQYDMQFCGGFWNATNHKIENYIFADNTKGPMAKGFICPPNSKCISNANPYNGRISFDNIINSMELIFVVMSANTFSDLMYYTMDSDNMGASLFFIFSIFFLTVWMVNLLIAVLYSSFEVAHEKYTNNGSDVKENILVSYGRRYRAFIQAKANDSPLPRWAERAFRIYKRVEWVFVLTVLINICAFATLKHNGSASRTKNIYTINRVTSVIMFVETVIRLIIFCKTPWKILSSPSYIYDSITSLIWLIMSISPIQEKLGKDFDWLTVLPISRFYRVVILFSVTRNLWKKVLKNALIIWNLSAFYFLFVFLASLIVLLYFDGTLNRDDMDDVPYGFYSLPNSFITLFKIGSTENWTDSLYAMQEHAPNLFAAFFGSTLIILWFILANLVVLNVFVAVIASSFDVDEEDKRPLQIKHYLKVVYPEKIRNFTNVPLLDRIRRKFSKRKVNNSEDFKQFLFRGTAILSIAQNYSNINTEGVMDNNESSELPNPELNYLKRVLWRIRAYRSIKSNPFFKEPKVVFVESKDSNKQNTLKIQEWEDEKLAYLREHPSFNNTYFLFPPNHGLRKFCQKLVSSSYGKRTNNKIFFDDTPNKIGNNEFFSHFGKDLVVVITFISTVLMVYYSCYATPIYRKTHHDKWSWIMYFEPIFVSLFTIEFLVKTIADGFIYSPNAYLLNPWNRIDLLVLIALWIDFISWLTGDGTLTRIIKGVSALRALRFLTISSMARATFKQVMFDGITYIFGACAIAFSILFPYTVWGLVIFRGQLGVCNDGDLSYSQCYNEYSNTVFKWNILMPRSYGDPVLHLNSFSSAFRSMYEIVSLEGWTDLLENMMSTTGVGQPAKLFASPYNGFFLIMFNFLSMVFILNIFISFIIGNYSRLKGTAYLTVAEKSWLEVKRLLSQAKPEPMPNFFNMGRIRRKCYFLVVEKKNFYFSAFMQIILYIHIFGLLLSRDQPHGHLSTNQNALFMLTSSTLLMQECMHIYGLGVRLYVRKKWNVFRALVLLFAYLTNIYQFVAKHFIPYASNGRDILQLAVLLLIIPQNDTLNELINTATASLPSILSLVYLWFILFLVYAIALNQVFGLTKLGPNTSRNINARTVTKALLLLFRCSFGEGWNYIMNDFTLEQPYCFYTEDGTYTDCGTKAFAYTIMMSWNILSMYILSNMFISMIVEKFSYVYHREQKKDSPANQEEIRKFKAAWKKYDPDGVGEFDIQYLPKFMHSFDGPLSFKIWEGRLTVKSLKGNYMKVNPNDPYDVKIDFDGLNKELSSIDYEKVKERLLEYRRFIHEIKLESKNHDCVQFQHLIRTVPLYTAYDKTECLGIDDYVKAMYNINKIDRLIENENNYNALRMIATRWKFVVRKNKIVLPELRVPLSSYPYAFTSVDDIDSTKSPIIKTQETNLLWSPLQQKKSWFGEKDGERLGKDNNDYPSSSAGHLMKDYPVVHFRGKPRSSSSSSVSSQASVVSD